MTSARQMRVEKIMVAGQCPECSASDLKRYEVLSAGGWFKVVKCQTCLASIHREPWTRLGHVDRGHVDVLLGSADGSSR